jgi:branched-chain amino acid transport system permease protein
VSFDIFLQYLLNGLMLGVIYAIVAVGFTLYFGVLDVIKFSHGDILMVGAFAGLTTYIGIAGTFDSPWLQLLILVLVSLSIAALPWHNHCTLSHTSSSKSPPNQHTVGYFDVRFGFA